MKLSERLARMVDDNPLIHQLSDDEHNAITEAAALARRVEGAAKVKVRGKVGEVCMVPVSHDYCGKRVAIVEMEGSP